MSCFVKKSKYLLHRQLPVSPALHLSTLVVKKKLRNILHSVAHYHFLNNTHIYLFDYGEKAAK